MTNHSVLIHSTIVVIYIYVYIYTHTAHTHFPLSSEFMNEAELKNLLQMIKSGILPGTYAYYTLIEREGGEKP